jgi:hypothetical protein
MVLTSFGIAAAADEADREEMRLVKLGAAEN